MTKPSRPRRAGRQAVAALIDARLLDAGEISAANLVAARTAPPLPDGRDPVAEATRVAGLVNAAVADGRLNHAERVQWARDVAANPNLEGVLAELQPVPAAAAAAASSRSTGAPATIAESEFEAARLCRRNPGAYAAEVRDAQFETQLRSSDPADQAFAVRRLKQTDPQAYAAARREAASARRPGAAPADPTTVALRAVELRRNRR